MAHLNSPRSMSGSCSLSDDACVIVQGLVFDPQTLKQHPGFRFRVSCLVLEVEISGDLFEDAISLLPAHAA